MNFTEAMERARAEHTIARVHGQPGNDLRTEYRCSCGEFVFKTRWARHIIDAADRMIEKEAAA